MNTQSRFFPLWLQFLILLGIAIAVPVGVMLVVVVDATNRLNEQNLAAVVEQVGRYREYLIRTDLENAVQLLDSVTDNAQVYNLIVSAARNLTLPGTTPETRQSLIERTNTDLRRIFFGTSARLVDSYWILSREGEVLLSEANSNRTLPFNSRQPREDQSDAFLQARDRTQSTDTRLFAITTRSGLPNFELVLILRDIVGITVGYLVVDLDVNNIVQRHLATPVTLPLYSFVVLPDGQTTLQLAETRRQNLVDTRTPVVQRALEGSTSGTLSYQSTLGGQVRQLNGFYDSIRVLGQTLGFVTEIDRGLIVSQRNEYFANNGFVLFIVMVALLLVLVLVLSQATIPPLIKLRQAVQGLIRGNFAVPLPSVRRPDELGALAADFANMRGHVQQVFGDLRVQISDRERQVRLTQALSRTALAERDVNVLMARIVALIIENFPTIYHAQIFLLDQEGRFAVLRASTGRAGQELMKRGHRLAVGSVSVIGQVTEQGQMIVVRDIGASAVHRRNEFLPETQAELAIPLKLGDRVIGALDLQSKERDSFPPDQISALQTLADQITIAIENARLYEQSQQLLRTVEQETRQRTQQAWQELFTLLRTPMLSASAGNVTGFDSASLREAAMRSMRTVVGTRTDHGTIPVVIPVVLRGIVLGAVEFELRDADFSYGKVLLAEELVGRFAISLDNARLFLENARNAERENFVNALGGLLTTENTIKGILETAIREVSAALGTPQIGVRFTVNESNGNGSDDVTLVASPDAEGRLN